jgi:precorrin-6B methylase 1
VTLKEKETEAYSDYRDWLGVKPLTISASNAAVLRAGGPLTNWVTVDNQGRSLSFEYQMRGDGGRYRLIGTEDRTKPPEVAIYQKGKKVGSGRFEYG